MKLKDYPGFTETIPVLFGHFRTHGIETSLWYKIDFKKILRLLMDSEFERASYSGNWEHYNIDFSDYKCSDDEVYYFTFGNDNNSSSHFLLVDVGKNGRGFITMSFVSERMLPITRGLTNEQGFVAVTVMDHERGITRIEYEKKSIMSDEEFEDFLKRNTHGGKLNFIEVD